MLSAMFVDLAQKPQARMVSNDTHPDPKRWMPSGDFPWRIVETGVIMINTNALPASQSYRSNACESEDLRIPPRELIGSLRIPKKAFAVIVFAHGSGSSRLSPRNVAVARALNDRGMATLLFDLLTAAEEVDRVNVFDIPLLAGRLIDAVRWLEGHALPAAARPPPLPPPPPNTPCAPPPAPVGEKIDIMSFAADVASAKTS